MLNRSPWRSQSSRRFLIGLALALVVPQIAATPVAFAADEAAPPSGIVLAQSNVEGPAEIGTEESRPLEPRYQPREPEPAGWYNDSYIFGVSRALANSTISPAGKAPLFLFTIPVDIALLPVAVIGGLFG